MYLACKTTWVQLSIQKIEKRKKNSCGQRLGRKNIEGLPFRESSVNREFQKIKKSKVKLGLVTQPVMPALWEAEEGTDL